jgi:hypothetical protein
MSIFLTGREGHRSWGCRPIRDRFQARGYPQNYILQPSSHLLPFQKIIEIPQENVINVDASQKVRPTGLRWFFRTSTYLVEAFAPEKPPGLVGQNFCLAIQFFFASASMLPAVQFITMP